MSTIFFNFKDITSVPYVGANVTLTPLIYPVVNGNLTLINDPITLKTDATGSVYYSNIVLANIFKIEFQNTVKNSKVIPYYAGIPIPTNDDLQFNASTYIISASIDNGNPTTVYFDLANIIKQAYSVKKVVITPANSFIPNVNSGSVVPGDGITFNTLTNGTFTASNMVPGGYTVDCYSNPTKNIAQFSIQVPSNSGSINVNQIIVPSTANQLNISYAFPNAPGQSYTIEQLFATFQTIIQSGSYFHILVDNAFTSSLSNVALYAISGGTQLNTGSLVPISSSWSINSINAATASYFVQTATTLNTASLYYITSSWALTAVHGGDQLITASLVPITASNAITASQAVSAAFSPTTATTINTGSTLQVTSSWSNTASFALNAANSPTLITGSLVPITASVALTAISGGTQILTGSLVPITSSNAITSAFSVLALTSSIAIAANNLTNSNAVNNYFPKWINGILSNTSSLLDTGVSVSSSVTLEVPELHIIATASMPFYIENDAPWGNIVAAINIPDQVNAEFVLTSNDAAHTIKMAPTGNVSFNNVGNVIVSNTLTASLVRANNIIAPLTGSVFGTASWATNSNANNLATGSLVPVTSSWALNAIGAQLLSGSNQNITAAWAINALQAFSADFANLAQTALTASFISDATASWAIHAVSASYLGAGTASWANNAVTSSYSLKGKNVDTASLAVTSSYLNGNALLPLVISDGNNSASFTATEVDIYGNSVLTTLIVANSLGVNATVGAGASFGFLKGSPLLYISSSKVGVNTVIVNNTLDVAGNVSASNYTGSQFTGTASYANNALSASYASTASLLIGSVQNAQTATSASQASSSVTASYALQSRTGSFITTAQTASYISASNIKGNISAAYSVNADTASFIPNGTYLITSSWAQTASVANAFSFTIATASFALTAKTASLAVTTSYALQAKTGSYNISSSYALFADNSTDAVFATFAGTANTASYALFAANSLGSGTTLNTGSTYYITSSWAVSSSYAKNADSASTVVSASYSLTSSFATNAGGGSSGTTLDTLLFIQVYS